MLSLVKTHWSKPKILKILKILKKYNPRYPYGRVLYYRPIPVKENFRSDRGNDPLTREEAKAYIKDRCGDYLESAFGVNTRKPFQCLNPDRNLHHKDGDKHPSMSYDKKRKKVHCFTCSVDYDTLDLVAIKNNIPLDDHAEIFKRAYEVFGIEAEGDLPLKAERKTVKHIPTAEDTSQDDYLVECHKRVGLTDYFAKRGISDQVVNRFGLGYDPQYKRATGGKTWKAIIIPTGKGSFSARNTSQTAPKEDRYRKSGGIQFMNISALDRRQVVYVTEGELDCLSVITAGAEAVALGSVANIDKFLKHLKDQRPQAYLVPVLDNDEVGENGTEALTKGLDELGIPYATDSLSGKYGDPNEWLMKDRNFFLEAVGQSLRDHEVEMRSAEEDLKKAEEAEREEYIGTNSTGAYIPQFLKGVGESANTPVVKTGFLILDAVLDGGLYEGLYIVGSMSSQGKTTLVLQIADQVASHGQDVLIFSLEMARTELMAKSISRTTAKLLMDKRKKFNNTDCPAKTTRGILAGARYASYSNDEKKLISDAVEDYANYARHIYIQEGVGDIGAERIRKDIERHISFTGVKPVVFIDYLQLLSPYDVRASDKQNVDRAVLELKRISRDHKIPIVAVSSLNRESYNASITMSAFKESGAIEYGSDCLIGLQFQAMAEIKTDSDKKKIDIEELSKKTPRKMEIKILKQRNGGKGQSVKFDYYPQYNLFQEDQRTSEG